MLAPIKKNPVVLLTRADDLAAAVDHAVAAACTRPPRLSRVATVQECLAAVRLLRPALVLIDDSSSERPGQQLLAELQATQPGIHVVYIASRHSLEQERELRRQGVLFYIARPVESETLEPTLQGLLQGLLRDVS
jgi:response regulator of citrate/malate metabolism